MADLRDKYLAAIAEAADEAVNTVDEMDLPVEETMEDVTPAPATVAAEGAARMARISNPVSCTR